MIESSENLSTTLELDELRATERANVHFNARIQDLDGLLRICYAAHSPQEIRNLLENLDEVADKFDGEIIKVINRFAKPSPLGFRDLRILLSFPESPGYTGCLRVVASQMYESSFACLPYMAASVSIAAEKTLSKMGIASSYIVVIDNFTRDEPESLTLVYGFPSFEIAKHYAETRFRQCLATLNKQVCTLEELRLAWMQQGEDIIVGQANVKDAFHLCSDMLWEYMTEASVNFGCQWDALTELPSIKCIPVSEYNAYIESLID